MSYSSKLTTRFTALASNAIDPSSFVGEDVRFSSEFEVLEAELGKAQSMHASGQVDWLKILEDSETLLREQSKDLRVGAWLTWALYQRESYAGLLAGLGMLRQLCEQHWETVHPRKARTRSAAIGWLVPRLEQALGSDIAIKEQLPLFQQMVEHLTVLEAVLSQKLGADAPMLLPICRSLKNQVQRSASNEPPAGSVGAIVNQVKQVANQLFTPGEPVESEKDASKALRAQQEQGRQLCVWWQRQKATDLRALRLNRTLLWLPIEAIPECNVENVTALRGLPADKLKSYRDRFEQGTYADLLVELENSVAKAPFWFDGQRMVWECCQALNVESGMREVEMNFASLLQRLPILIELKFHDGTPFADAQTRAWIASQVTPHLQAAVAPPMLESSERQAPWEEALEAALPVLRKDGLKKAVQQLKQQMQGAQGGRERFFWQLGQARLCYTAKKYELAKTQLEALDLQLCQSGLDAWEPDLSLQVLHLLHTCCELLPQNHVVRERKDEIYRRLCHLDLEVVLE